MFNLYTANISDYTPLRENRSTLTNFQSMNIIKVAVERYFRRKREKKIRGGKESQAGGE